MNRRRGNNIKTNQTKQKFLLEQLEHRLLFSADLPFVVADIVSVDSNSGAITATSVETQEEPTHVVQTIGHQVVVIDSATPDLDSILSDLEKHENNDYAVYVLDAEQNGIQQVTKILSKHDNISALHVISHGSEGSVALGHSAIGMLDLLTNAEEIAGWQDSFTADGDILLYGCELAATEQGQNFINTLSQLTASDVAASVDVTGSIQSGGDWDLEYRTGAVNTAIVLSEQMQSDFSGVLMNITVTTTADTLDSGISAGNASMDLTWLMANPGVDSNISLREAVIAANNTSGAGAVTITLGSGTYQISIGGISENFSESGDFNLLRDIDIVGTGSDSTIIEGNGTDRIFDVRDNATVNFTDLTMNSGGGTIALGGALKVQVNTTVTLTEVVVSNSFADDGGGIHSAGTLTITNSTIETNTAGNRGGGLYAIGVTTITGSTFTRNDTAFDGGAIFSENSNPVEVTNSTFTDNSAGDNAGAVDIFLGTLTNVTITGNTANTGGGLYGYNTLSLKNVLIANNSALFRPDVAFGLNSLGGNLIGDSTGSSGFIASDILDVSPLLGALQDNGGPTHTVELMNGSRGVDEGITVLVPSVDQRGETRGALTDIGAYERVPAPPNFTTPLAFSVAENYSTVLPITVTDPGSLPLQYSLTGSNDDSLFDVGLNSGDVTFKTPPDFETPTDGGTNNTYIFTLTADNGNGGVTSETITVAVTDISANIIVSTLADTSNGDIASPEHLNSDKGVDGEISLREAILAANNASGPVSISFAISDALVGGVHTLSVGTGGLPTITNSVTIDATTDTDYVDAPVIVLDGSAAGATHGLHLGSDSDGSTIKGLAIVNFDQSGIYIGDSHNNTINANYLGTDGTNDLGNGTFGIEIEDSSGTQIGDTDFIDRNVISANGDSGILLTGTATSGTTIQGNLIGTNFDGTSALGNTFDGISIIQGAHDNILGGSGNGESNVISGNLNDGIELEDSGTDSNIIRGNHIGTDFNGTNSLGNGRHGVVVYRDVQSTLIGGSGVGQGNLISGNGRGGIVIDGGDQNLTLNNVISGNLIGTDKWGITAINNGTTGSGHGIEIKSSAAFTTVGGTTLNERNIISGSAEHGISITTASNNNSILGNYIGTNITGSLAIANGESGISLSEVSGTIIGSTTGTGWNLISGNGTRGIELDGNAASTTINNTIQANRIGTDAAGTGIIANTGPGIDLREGASNNVIGGDLSLGQGNTISGNTSHGVLISHTQTTDNSILGNYIGTTLDGTSGLGNQHDGITIYDEASSNTIGSGNLNERNVIADNGYNGIHIYGVNTLGNQVLGNYIGTDVSGTSAIGNNGDGVLISTGASGNTIGGLGALGNTISGNDDTGISIEGPDTDRNDIYGNYIGTNYDGTVSLGNTNHGIYLLGDVENTNIGGSLNGQGNVISGNRYGIELTGSGTTNNNIYGNYIGTNAADATTIANTNDGIRITTGAHTNTIGGVGSYESNVISGNGGDGIEIVGPDSDNNIIKKNFIGTTADGLSALGNGQKGIFLNRGIQGTLIGGSGSEGNVVSGNTYWGVVIDGQTAAAGNAGSNTVSANHIGVDVSGLNTIGNGAGGVLVYGGSTHNIIGGDTSTERNVISGNATHGVVVSGSTTTHTTISGNYIGTNSTGTLALGNLGDGIQLTLGTTNNTIGGLTTAERNVISGNINEGIEVSSADTDNNAIVGNYIGVTASGTTDLGNSGNGIHLFSGPQNNTIGGGNTNERNIISGNTLYGVSIDGDNLATTISNRVLGNYIGTDYLGLSGIGNNSGGVYISQGASQNQIGGDRNANEGNLISGNSLAAGISVEHADSSDNLIIGNMIGTDVSGSLSLPNNVGIHIIGAPDTIIGGTTDGHENLVSGNTVHGIYIVNASSAGTQVLGNLIGTILNGSLANANGYDGIRTENGATQITIGGTDPDAGNVISGNSQYGVNANSSTQITIQGNYIGTTSNGTAAAGNTLGGVIFSVGTTSSLLGGVSSSAGNVISGNSGDGVTIDTTASDITLSANLIGLAAGGVAALGNNGSGILVKTAGNTIGGTTSTQRNTIGSNSSHGIYLTGSADDTVIVGNSIGLAFDGTTPVGNSGSGLLIESSNNSIGGEATNQSNTIANNTADGITITGTGNNNALLGNLVFGNAGDSIDLDNNGTTVNDTLDVDTGPNNLQNFPLITSVASDTVSIVNIEGSLNTEVSSTYRIEFFASSGVGAPVPGQAERYLGFTEVTTDGSGDASFDTLLNVALSAGEDVTATATQKISPTTYGNTSEFFSHYTATLNTAPTTSGITNLTVDEDASDSVLDLTTSFSDLQDSDSQLTFDLISVSNPGLFTSTNLTLAGELTLDYALNQHGFADITVRVTDTGSLFVESTFRVTVDSVNDLPVFTSPSAFSIAEGTSTVGTAVVTDLDGGAPKFYLAVTADSSLFTINEDSGLLSFAAAPDAENALDAGTNNIYDLILEVDDGSGDRVSQAATVTVTDLNESVIGPITDNDLADNDVLENAGIGASVGIIALATDADISASVVYSLDTSAGGLFAIDATTGEVTVNGGLNREAQDSHSIRVRALSSDGSFSIQDFTITVMDVNDVAPAVVPLQTFTVDEDAITNTIVDTVLASDPDLVGTLQNWTIVSGNGAGLFQINGSTGEITIDDPSTLDYETTNQYTLGITVSDGVAVSSTESLVINVQNVNEDPLFASPALFNITENTTAIGTAVSTDVDGNAPQYTLVGSIDDSLFAIDTGTGDITFNAAPDFEAPSDTGINNQYNLTIQVDDQLGGIVTQAVQVNVSNVNEYGASAIADINSSINTVDEDAGIGDNVGITAFSQDADAGDDITYSLTNDAGNLFDINTSSGEITVKNLLNFESAPSHAIQVQALSTDGSIATADFTISVGDINERPTFTSSAINTATEDTAYTYNIITNDIEGDALTITSTLLPGWLNLNDNGNGTATLSGTPLNADVGPHNVTLTVSDGSLQSTQFIAIVVTNTNDAPVFTSPPTYDVPENVAAIGTVATIDADGDTPIYSLAGIIDDSRFSIDSVTGTLSFSTAPDFENPLDAGLDNIYNLTVQVSDGLGGITTQNLIVTVTDTNDNSASTVIDSDLADNLVSENAPIGNQVGITASSQDIDAPDSISYTLTNDAGGLFDIDTLTGNVTLIGPLDFESSSSHLIVVQADSTDGSQTSTAFSISVGDINETPTILSTPILTAVEDSLYSYTLIATDVDGNSLDYSSSILPGWLSLVDNGDGTALLSGTPDNSAVGNHPVTIELTDGSFVVPQIFSIVVSNTNDAPILTSSPIYPVIENTTTVGTITATDADADPIVYTLVGTVDDTLFSIDNVTGALSFIHAPDFEAPVDADGNNTYELLVQASDSNLGITTQSITISVTNEFDSNILPIIDTDSRPDTVDENTSPGTLAGITAFASDPDIIDTVTYSLTEDAAGMFSIDLVTGVVTLSGTPDRESNSSHDITVLATSSDGSQTTMSFTIVIADVNEAPEFASVPVTSVNEDSLYSYQILTVDSEGDNVDFSANLIPGWLTLIDNGDGSALLTGTPDNTSVGTHNIIISVTDGVSQTLQNFSIEVFNTNDAPVIVSSAEFSINENSSQASAIIQSSDVDGALPAYSIAGGADAANFAIDANSGALRFLQPPDFEVPVDHNSDNTYEVVVRVDDGAGGSSSQSVLIRVLDLNEYVTDALTDADSAVDAVLENTFAGSAVGITALSEDLDGTDTIVYSLDSNADDRFLIDAQTGIVSVAGPINFENSRFHTIVVRATSSDGSSVTRSIDIDVVDANDNAPAIQSNRTVSILESAEFDSAIASLLASDIDTVGEIQGWSIVSGNDEGIFSVDAQTGELSVTDAALIDFETTPQYTLGVSVSDGVNSAVTESVVVDVIDTNESPFVASTDYVSSEGFTGVVGQIQITDPDTGATANLQIIGGTAQSVFEVGPDDHEIVQTGSLSPGTYTLEVRVTDNQGATTDATMMIRILQSDQGSLFPNELSGMGTRVIDETDSVSMMESTTADADTTYENAETIPEEVTDLQATSVVESTEEQSQSSINIMATQDQRFEGSQATTLQIDKNLEQTSRINQSSSGNASDRSYDLIVELLIDESDSFIRIFDVNLETLDFSTTLSPALLGALATMSSDVEMDNQEARERLELAIKAGTVATASLSIGFVTWLLRTGALVATVFSTSPLWRSFDPIPVLASPQLREENDHPTAPPSAH